MERTVTKEERKGLSPKGERAVRWWKTEKDQEQKNMFVRECKVKTLDYSKLKDYYSKENLRESTANNLSQTSRNNYQMLSAC